MISDLKPYPAMKDSGAEWLGEVPEHWEVRQLGRIGAFSKGNGGTKADEVAEGVPCVRYGDLYTRHRFFIENTKACVSPDRVADYTPIQYGDILLAGSGETIEEIGKSAVSLLTESACCGGDVVIFRPAIEVDAKFLGLATDCPQAAYQKSCMGRGITVMHIYGDELKYLFVTLPPLSEQAGIVRYLDHVDRRVRRLTRAKRKLIALLTEQKQAIIHRAVTRGLDPDVPLKDSGVEWLGEVPEHWEVRRLKQLTRFVNGLAFKPSDWAAEGVPIIRIQNLNGSNEFNYTTREDLPNSLLIQPGELLFAWSGNRGTSFGSFIWDRDFPGYLNQHIFKLTGYSLDRVYFSHMLRAVTRHVEDEKTHGIIGLVHVTKPELGRVLVPVAPIKEQIAIVEYLDQATADLDTTISRAEREIELLNEYRTRLIADVVTGKVDVREAAAALPEVDPLAEDDDADDLDADLTLDADELYEAPEEVEA